MFFLYVLSRGYGEEVKMQVNTKQQTKLRWQALLLVGNVTVIYDGFISVFTTKFSSAKCCSPTFGLKIPHSTQNENIYIK